MQRLSGLIWAGVLCALASPAHGVTQIRFERWTVYSHVRPEKALGPFWRSYVGVEFDATATAAD